MIQQTTSRINNFIKCLSYLVSIERQWEKILLFGESGIKMGSFFEEMRTQKQQMEEHRRSDYHRRKAFHSNIINASDYQLMELVFVDPSAIDYCSCLPCIRYTRKVRTWYVSCHFICPSWRAIRIDVVVSCVGESNGFSHLRSTDDFKMPTLATNQIKFQGITSW